MLPGLQKPTPGVHGAPDGVSVNSLLRRSPMGERRIIRDSAPEMNPGAEAGKVFQVVHVKSTTSRAAWQGRIGPRTAYSAPCCGTSYTMVRCSVWNQSCPRSMYSES